MTSIAQSRRRISGTGVAVRDGLASSNGRVGLIALVAALITLGFAVWLKVDLRRQVQIRMPLSNAANRLDAAIQTSLAALQDWALRRDEGAKTLRAEVWQTRIIPAVEALEAVARDVRAESSRTEIAALAADLRVLQVHQRWLQDTLHAPGNEPARFVYQQEMLNIVEPIRSSLDVILRVRPAGFSREQLLELSGYRIRIAGIEMASLAYLADGSAVNRDRLQRQLTDAARWHQQIDLDAPKADPDLLELAQLAVSEFRPLVAAAHHMMALRSRPNWRKTAAYLHQVMPLVDRIRAASSSLADSQTKAALRASRTVNLGTSVVVILSIIVGILAASGLYYSFRLEHQMQQIASKAKMLGQYAIEAPLGRGGMGEVYRARHALLRRPTAIKLLRASNAIDPQAQARFRQEVQLTSQLTHPNTVQVFDYGRTPEGVFYYAMELLEGVTLEELVRQTGPVPPARIVFMLSQVCGSLSEAHERRLLHRDLKPSNIMLTNRAGQHDLVKVLDFGLAAPIGSARAAKTLVGTPSYVAPEVIDDPSTASPCADIYALGAVAYFLLTGTEMFVADDVDAILSAHREVVPERPSVRLGRVVPERLEALVLTCLEKDPRQRPASAEHVGRLLRQCVDTPWTVDDAKAWWSDFGDALDAETQASPADAPQLDGLEIERSLSTRS